MIVVCSWSVSISLLLFTVRRYLYWLASFQISRADRPSREKSIAVLIAARNEAELLPRLFASLESCDYPRDLLSFTFISDGSTDATPRLMAEWCAHRERAQVLDLPATLGKGAALDRALGAAPHSELVAVLDADTEPAPDSLAWLAGAFLDPLVGAAGGYPAPRNPTVSMTSRYAALERWVYHLVTLAGKDALGLNPPAIGALCAFRRQALDSIGGFPRRAVTEDIVVSMDLVRCGWRTRWLRQAVTHEDVPIDLKGFRDQRSRWSRGLLESRRSASRFEDLMVAAGYLDRLVLAAGIVMAIAGWISPWIPALFILAPVITVWTALWRAPVRHKMGFVLAAIPMLIADLCATAGSAAIHLMGGPIQWAQRRPVAARGSRPVAGPEARASVIDETSAPASWAKRRPPALGNSELE
jgi:cellulose synthase/poly-beta-1,6-N-acetylglucosamine synthase-like glycosyltransferase